MGLLHCQKFSLLKETKAAPPRNKTYTLTQLMWLIFLRTPIVDLPSLFLSTSDLCTLFFHCFPPPNEWPLHPNSNAATTKYLRSFKCPSRPMLCVRLRATQNPPSLTPPKRQGSYSPRPFSGPCDAATCSTYSEQKNYWCLKKCKFLVHRTQALSHTSSYVVNWAGQNLSWTNKTPYACIHV